MDSNSEGRTSQLFDYFKVRMGMATLNPPRLAMTHAPRAFCRASWMRPNPLPASHPLMAFSQPAVCLQEG